MGVAISPNYNLDQFPNGMTLDDKIRVFSDRVQGWQLDIAKKCSQTAHGGFAVLHIVMSYFESISKYKEGYIGTGDSRCHFKKGFYDVFPDLRKHAGTTQDAVLGNLYEKVRCALYHGGMTDAGIFVTGDIENPVMFRTDGSSITINPKKLVEVLEVHLQQYVSQLKNQNNTRLRDNFETRF